MINKHTYIILVITFILTNYFTSILAQSPQCHIAFKLWDKGKQIIFFPKESTDTIELSKMKNQFRKMHEFKANNITDTSRNYFVRNISQDGGIGWFVAYYTKQYDTLWHYTELFCGDGDTDIKMEIVRKSNTQNDTMVVIFENLGDNKFWIDIPFKKGTYKLSDIQKKSPFMIGNSRKINIKNWKKIKIN